MAEESWTVAWVDPNRGLHGIHATGWTHDGMLAWWNNPAGGIELNALDLPHIKIQVMKTGVIWIFIKEEL